MNVSTLPLFRTLLIAGLFVLCTAVPVHAQEPEAPPAEAPAETPAPAEDAAPPETTDVPADATDEAPVGSEDDSDTTYYSRGSVVSVGDDAKLGENERADAVVSVFGSSTSEGRVSDAVVSVFGDTRVTGSVGDAVVAVLGDVYVNSKVGDTVVAVLGDVELGPEADVNEVVVIGGELIRAETAVVHRSVQRIFSSEFRGLRGLRPWVRHALLLGRPLALEPGLGWAWGVAFGFLALYVLLAVLFREGVDRCVQTLETRPGPSVVAAILTILLTPILILVLLVSMLGIAAVPFVVLGLFCATLFGKAVVLGWIGKRFTRAFEDGPLTHTAFAVLIGGLVVMALYLVPLFGFVLFNVIGVLGLGVVLYTLLLSVQSARRERAAAAGATSTGAAFSAGPSAETTNAEPAPPDAAATPESTAPAADRKPEATAQSLSDAAIAALPRATFWMRMGALAIDAVMIAIVVGMVNESGELWLLLLGAYGAVMWKLRGTTIGGIVFGLKVVRRDGRPIDWATAIVRALSCFLSAVVAGLGFIWIIFDEERQAWHDKIAGTIVVTMPKGVSLL